MEKLKNSILIVDDDYQNIEALLEILGDEYEIYIAKDGQDAIETANEFIPDIILLDIVMPDMNGYEVLTELRKSEKTQHIPVIFVTGLSNADDERKGLVLGAADYIIKPFSSAIVELRVRNQIRIVEQLRTIEKLSMTDQLTDLPNRRSFENRLNMEWHRVARDKSPLSILMIDVDKFKNYNDSFGHQQGDVALQSIANTLTKAIRRLTDFAARWGGEEFVVLLPGSDSKGALEIAEHIRTQVVKLEVPADDSKAAKITVSIGVNTHTSEDGFTINDFISLADAALYAAKAAGRNCVRSIEHR